MGVVAQHSHAVDHDVVALLRVEAGDAADREGVWGDPQLGADPLSALGAEANFLGPHRVGQERHLVGVDAGVDHREPRSPPRSPAPRRRRGRPRRRHGGPAPAASASAPAPTRPRRRGGRSAAGDRAPAAAPSCSGAGARRRAAPPPAPGEAPPQRRPAEREAGPGLPESFGPRSSGRTRPACRGRSAAQSLSITASWPRSLSASSSSTAANSAPPGAAPVITETILKAPGAARAPRSSTRLGQLAPGGASGLPRAGSSASSSAAAKGGPSDAPST